MTNEMKFAFFGSPWFAAIILEKLIAGGFVPSVVVCNPDRRVGRKQIMTAPATKQLILNSQLPITNKISILQPEHLKNENYKMKIGEVDFAIVAAYAQIIPKEIFTLPRLGTIGVHPSLLPHHRGATPIQTAILEGDEETGTTLFLMDDKVDHGPILAQARMELPITNYQLLEEHLAKLSGELLVKTLPDFLSRKIEPLPQNEAKATFTKKFSTRDTFVSEETISKATRLPNIDAECAKEIERKIRALNPEPGVWTIRNGKRVKLLEAEIRDGKLVLKKIQVEGKKTQIV
jgi:methionyl-tRNA formyltransferase